MGYMGQSPSRGHGASPQSGLSVGCMLCSSSKKLRGLSLREQAWRLSIPPSISVAGVSSSLSPSCSAMRRGAARGSAIHGLGKGGALSLVLIVQARNPLRPLSLYTQAGSRCGNSKPEVKHVPLPSEPRTRGLFCAPPEREARDWVLGGLAVSYSWWVLVPTKYKIYKQESFDLKKKGPSRRPTETGIDTQVPNHALLPWHYRCAPTGARMGTCPR